MPANDDVLSVAAEWVVKAENDLRTAAHTLRLQPDCPTDTVCFHAQPCVEKYLKSLLVVAHTPFPKSHDLGALVRMLPEAWQPDLAPAVLRQLSDYGTITRYPGDYDPIDLAEARRVVAIARRVRAHVRTLLPRGALKRPKKAR